MSKNKHIYLIEVEKLLEDYHVISEEIVRLSKALSSFNPEGKATEEGVKEAEEFKKNLFLQQTYDTHLLSLVSNLRLLHKLIHLEKVELGETLREHLQKVVDTYEEMLIVKNGQVEIVSDFVKTILESDGFQMTVDEFKKIINGERD